MVMVRLSRIDCGAVTGVLLVGVGVAVTGVAMRGALHAIFPRRVYDAVAK